LRFDASGDILPDTGQGYFVNDVRCLSTYLFRIDGARPLLLAAYRLPDTGLLLRATNGASRRLRPGMVTLECTRTVDRDLHDQLILSNNLDRPLGVRVTLELGADFLTAREVEALAPSHSRLRSAPDEAGNDLQFTAPNRAQLRQTRVRFSQPASFQDSRAHFGLILAPAGQWTLSVEVAGVAPEAPG
jgi:hypothetical protein